MIVGAFVLPETSRHDRSISNRNLRAREPVAAINISGRIGPMRQVDTDDRASPVRRT